MWQQPDFARESDPLTAPIWLGNRLFSIPENKIDTQGEASRLGKGSSIGHDEGAKQHFGPGVSGDARKLDNLLAAVC